MAGVKPRNSCSSLFKTLEILALPCKYIFSLINFIVNNQEHFQTNSAVQCVKTRSKNQLHRPVANDFMFSEKCIFAGIKIFNSLTSSLTSLINIKTRFKLALNYIKLITHFF
jgi:hypothetical protein